MPRAFALALFACLTASAAAHAQDEEDDLLKEDDEGELDKIEPGTVPPEGDLLEEEETGPTGGDSADIYRQYQKDLAELDVDEQIQGWEEYLETYPATQFRDRIEKHIEELTEELYGERIPTGGEKDADEQEIDFSQGLLIETLNPRTRIQAGFEWGFPDYINLFADYEHQLRRDLGVHGGLRHRYTGWSLEGGARWAFVKSVRTQTIVTAIADVHVNTLPVAFVGLRPQIGIGQRFFGKLDAQAQLGADFELRAYPGVRLIGGANVTYRAAERVALFGETSLNMKNLTWKEGGTFRFNIFSFGMKFYPALDAKGVMEVNLGASVPYTSNYWMHHFGSIMGQVNYYL